VCWIIHGNSDFGEAPGYGPEGHPDFWIAEGAGTGPNRETHFALRGRRPRRRAGI
jgi:hypothetical protein